MSAVHDRLAKILRTKPEVLLDFETKMNKATGGKDVLAQIVEENDFLVQRTLAELSLPKEQRTAKKVYDTMMQPINHMDEHLYEFLGKPELNDPNSCGKLCQIVLILNQPKPGFFIKKESAIRMLEKFPPPNLLGHFGYRTVSELIENKGFTSVFSALRFAEDTNWMHEFFDKGYGSLTAEDFEERDVELKVLEPEWSEVAEKFLEKKYHNISHLKELGIIFVVPLKLNIVGETLRTVALLLHYLNEVPFYSNLFRKFVYDRDFVEEFKSLMRGDVLSGPLPAGANFRIVQTYLAKDNPNDPRLFEPHFNPEAEHWYKAEGDLARLISEPIGQDIKGGLSFGFWQGLDFVGDFFPENLNAGSKEGLVGFDLIDLAMSLVRQGEIKYLYHQQEALWNKMFIEYLGRDKIKEIIEQNILKGFISL